MLKASFVGCVIAAASLSLIRAGDEVLDDPLKALGERYTAQEKRYEQAQNDAKTDQERNEAFEKLDPRNAFIDDLLAIEKSHRGQPAAISALFVLMRNARSVGNPDIPASLGRVKAIEIAREYYMEHPDLDLLLVHFESGAFVTEAEGLLRDATKNPRQSVRTTARYQLARFLQHKAGLAEMFAAISTPADAQADVNPAVLKMRSKLRQQVESLAIDPVAARNEAVDLIEEILAEDLKTRRHRVMQEGPGNLKIRRVSAESLDGSGATYARLAEAVRFEIQHLQPGRVAPELVGKDADGVDFKLSDYRGRVVLLMFSANWCGPCKAMYPDIRKLLAERDGQPFAVLAVMGDHSIDSVIQDTNRGDIRWRTWFDGDPGPIATTWNIHRWPTLFLLDHNGIIAKRQPGRSYEILSAAIDTLLTAQKADPNAEELLREHPLPELPILKRAP